MPLQTPQYLLEAFLDGDIYSASADRRRFSTVDNQLHAITKIVGDGRIDGWEITDAGFPNITISPGSGLIDGYYVNTFNDQIFELSAGGTYHAYAQRRVGSIGTWSPRSNLATVGWADAAPPAMPANAQATSPDAFTVILNWDNNAEIDFDHYEVYRSYGVSYELIANTDDTSRYTDDGAQEMTTYYYRIYAVDESGFKSTPAELEITTELSDEPPPNPSEVEMHTSEGGVNILWKTPPFRSQSLSVVQHDDLVTPYRYEMDTLHYQVEIVDLDSDNTEIESTRRTFSVDTDSLFYRINELSVGQRYRVTIRTIDHFSRMSTGVWQYIIPRPDPAPRDPSAIEYTLEEGASGSVKIDLQWLPGGTPYDPEIPYRYRIYIKVDGQEESAEIDVPIGFTNEEIAVYTYNYTQYFSIPEDTIVTLRLTSLDKDGNESHGNYLRFQTPKYSQTSPIRSLRALFLRNDAVIEISWKTGGDVDDVHLVIYRRDEGGGAEVEILDTYVGRSNKYNLHNIKLNHRYRIRLTPYDRRTPGDTDEIIETTPTSASVSRASAPSGVTLDPADSEMRLTWRESSSQNVDSYRVYRKNGQLSFQAADWTMIDILPSGTNSYVDYGLTNDSAYSYYITSVDVYRRESLDLDDNVINLNYATSTPVSQGTISAPYNLTSTLVGNDVHVTWDTDADEFESFTLYRSVGNRHTWEIIDTFDRSVLAYVDSTLPHIHGATYYFLVDKTANDADLIVQTTNVQPENSIYIGSLTLGASSITTITTTNRRDIKDLEDPLEEYLGEYILDHTHDEQGYLGADRISLSRDLVVTDWSSTDGKTWTTEETITGGTGFILKVNGKFPTTYYSVNADDRTIVFSEPITTVNPFSRQSVESDFSIELHVVDAEEVEGSLDAFRFDDIHAKQVAFDQIAEAQVPDINHDGRIKEVLIPKSFLLQRFNNRSFIIPEGQEDTTKTFGNSTTFYSVIDSDGLIEEVIDFDLQEDGVLYAFRKPSFSQDTIHHLKQTVDQDFVETVNSTLIFGDHPEAPAAQYVRCSIEVPADGDLSSATIDFTAHQTTPGNGDQVVIRVGLLNPASYAEPIDLDHPALAAVPVLGEITWIPEEWSSLEIGDHTSVDVSGLVDLLMQSASYRPGIDYIFKFTVDAVTAAGNYRMAYGSQPDPYDPITAAPAFTSQHVYTRAEVNSDPGGFQSEKSYFIYFEFDDDKPERWVRVTTRNTPLKPNPAIKFNKRLRFRILLLGSAVRLSLGVRETRRAVVVGSDGGISGSVEWLGVDSVVYDSDGDPTPVGMLIQPSNQWQEIDLDLQDMNVVAFLDGNHQLSGDYGVLEHLAFTIEPSAANPSGPFHVYIDKIEQVSDVLAAGTSQGLQISEDFGSEWELARYTDTPVHKFYRAQNNGFLWSISATQVLLCNDPAYWYTTNGTTGIEYIRDITEDENGNMFISTDRGVYWMETAIINTYPTWRQTQPINAFTTDCFGMINVEISSGSYEMWVSTEIGIFSTTNRGQTWSETGMTTRSLPAYGFIEMRQTGDRSILTHTRKHILRKRDEDSNFVLMADMETQHNVFDIWTFAYFGNRLYLSTSKGVYRSDADPADPLVTSLEFSKVFAALGTNDEVLTTFGMDVVPFSDSESRLMLSQEGRLMAASEDGVISMRRSYTNKELPSFFIDDSETTIGFIYNAFNNALVFREPPAVDSVVSAAYLPRRTYIAPNGGWAHVNPIADVFIYKNGRPMWIDFKLDTDSLATQVDTLVSSLTAVTDLSNFNSLYPDSETQRTAALADATSLQTALDEETLDMSSVSSLTIALIESYGRFLSMITDALKTSHSLTALDVKEIGIARADRSTGSRAAEFETDEGFIAEDSTNVHLDTVEGEVDFDFAYSSTTSLTTKATFTFDKFDRVFFSVFNTTIKGIGEFSHRQLEDRFEAANSGLSSGLARVVYAGLLKSGVRVEMAHNNFFAEQNLNTVQSRFYSACTTGWYDLVNSTIDFETILSTTCDPPPRLVTSMVRISEDPYMIPRIWIGTDRGIYEADVSNGVLVYMNLEGGHILSSYYIEDIFIDSDGTIYVCATDMDSWRSEIFYTLDAGNEWSRMSTIGLPARIIAVRSLNNIKIAATTSGVYYNDNDFGEWYPADAETSGGGAVSSTALSGFQGRTGCIEVDTFAFMESSKQFFTSGGARVFFHAGSISSNVDVVNKLYRFKSHTWVATDAGLFDDSNSLLSDSVAFSRQTGLEETSGESSNVNVSDIASMGNALYCAATNGKIYRFLDGEWTRYSLPDFGPIQRLLVVADSPRTYAVAASFNRIRSVDITPGTGVFDQV